MKNDLRVTETRKKAVWGPGRATTATALLFLGLATSAMAAGIHSRSAPQETPGVPGTRAATYKLDSEVSERSRHGHPLGKTSVIVTLVPGAALPAEFRRFARPDSLDIINGRVLDLPNGVLRQLEAHPAVFQVHHNRDIKTHNYRTAVTVGARVVQQHLGYTGAGIGVAVIDSGITTWHDDLKNTTAKVYPYGNQRVTKFVDFVNGRTLPYDDNGHGSHVAGTILGNGTDSNGEKSGIAPRAALISLKVLDANGAGTISNIISALNWVVVNAATYNIRVVNMSVGAGIYESYWTDPLTVAAKAVTDRGITIVAAAGNLGKNAAGQPQSGGITAPGNAPWVLTVGASNTMGTLTRGDDTLASYSSAGPTYLDFAAKPDLVAPGTGTVSLAVPGSTFYATKAASLRGGTLALGAKPYLVLSGTSMAAPVVSGTVALMLQANPTLTPNLIKAILQYTAQQYPGYDALRQGAGFLNALGAVRLAKYYAGAAAGEPMPVQQAWSRQIIWGNQRLTGGILNPAGNAWGANIVWGTAKTFGVTGDNIVWGTAVTGENIVWGTTVTGQNIVWGTAAHSDNIVWGTDCGGADCADVIWGAADSADNLVWGTAVTGENIVWGTAIAANIVWGTATASNIVWGTAADVDVTWGSSGEDADVFPDAATGPPVDLALELGDAMTTLTVTDPVSGITTTTVTDLVTGATTSTIVTPPLRPAPPAVAPAVSTPVSLGGF
jgi:serine protease AprX